MFKILICEESLSYLAPSLFNYYHYESVQNNHAFIEQTFKKNYDLYIVHIACYQALKELKDAGDTTPTIFIDEYYNLSHLKKAFTIGDDYIIKPFYNEEIQIKVQYHYKKIYSHASNIIRYKDYYYHTKSKQLYLDKKNIKLSPNTLKLIKLFFTHLNEPLSKDIIYEELESDNNGSLRVYISKLNKLGLNITYNRAIFSYMLVL